jgi:FixJ family two-component response regulator
MTPARVLLVAPTPQVLHSLTDALRAAGFEAAVAIDFAAAKRMLDSRPDVLITELKLGPYNGLHLAIRASGLGTPSIVIGEADPVLEADARAQRAEYLELPVDDQRVIEVMRGLLQAARHTRRSPRKQVPGLDAFADQVQAQVLDVSYEGLRLATPFDGKTPLPNTFTISLPRFNFSCQAQRIWTSQPSKEQDVFYGAAIAPADVDTAIAWRTLVDTLPGLALAN